MKSRIILIDSESAQNSIVDSDDSNYTDLEWIHLKLVFFTAEVKPSRTKKSFTLAEWLGKYNKPLFVLLFYI